MSQIFAHSGKKALGRRYNIGFYNLPFSWNYGDNTKGNGMGRACTRVTNGWNRKCTHNILSWKKKEKTTSKALSKSNIIKMFLMEERCDWYHLIRDIIQWFY
jgi:hypothetical protein